MLYSPVNKKKVDQNIGHVHVLDEPIHKAGRMYRHFDSFMGLTECCNPQWGPAVNAFLCIPSLDIMAGGNKVVK